MSNETSPPESIVVSYWQAINVKDFGKLDALLSLSLETESGKNRKTILRDLKSLSDGFPDLTFHVDNVFANGKDVAVRWTMTGTHTAAFGPYTKPTGRSINAQGVALFKVHEGVITEFWPGADRSKIAAQLSPGQGNAQRLLVRTQGEV